MNFAIRLKRINSLVSFFSIVALAGCTVGPHYQAPAPPSISSYTSESQPVSTTGSDGAAGTAQSFHPASQVLPNWWTLFGSPELDAMVQRALANSPSLTQAAARLTQEQEELNARTGATKYPAVTGNASVQEQQLNLAAFGIPFPNPSPFTLLNGSVSVFYAFDFFGAHRHLIEGLQAQRDYQAWQLKGARLMLAGNVVAAAIRQAQLHAQIDLTRQILALQNRALQIAEQRLASGGIAESEVRSQRTAMAQTEATLPTLQRELSVVNDELAILMGEVPAEAQIAALSLDSFKLPAELPLSVPSSLVHQRPDIRSAESLLHEASANVGVASANLYPQIVLSGSGGASGTSFLNGGDIWNVGASLAQPIFDGGALRAEKRKAQAAYHEADGLYKQTVLEAFQQVADTLSSIQNDAETLKSREQAATEAAANFQIATERQQAGGMSLAGVLNAEQLQLQTALDRTSAASARYSDTATLFQALGGGWWNDTSATAPH